MMRRTNRAVKHDKAQFARRLRQHLTPAEELLWPRLRAHQLGHHIRRQHPIGHAIADFACPEKKLVIEIDGAIHQHSEVAAHDQIRKEDLIAQGWRILRFSNDEVLADPEAVIGRIRFSLDHALQG